eukprot:m.271337 g.271337  ORF g.271337 m.271337 type:complete len:219 (-) comp15683_c1_seq10:341-997(-)
MPATITPADNSAVFVEGARKFRRQSASRGAVDVLSTSRSKAFHERLRQLHMTLVRATPAFLLGFVIAQKFLVSSVLTASSSLKLSSPSPNTNLTVPDSVVALTLQNNALGLSATEFLLATTSCVASLLHIATLLQEPHEARRTIAMTLFAIAAILYDCVVALVSVSAVRQDLLLSLFLTERDPSIPVWLQIHRAINWIVALAFVSFYIASRISPTRNL